MNEGRYFDAMIIGLNGIDKLTKENVRLRDALKSWRQFYGWDHIDGVPKPPSREQCMRLTEEALTKGDDMKEITHKAYQWKKPFASIPDETWKEAIETAVEVISNAEYETQEEKDTAEFAFALGFVYSKGFYP